MPMSSLMPHRITARSLVLGLLAIALALSCGACGHSPEVLVAFRTEQQAQEHCPKDTVVWVDPQSGGYHLKGGGSYGHAEPGRYTCRGEAERAGMREIAN
jgi:hypothetical protein